MAVLARLHKARAAEYTDSLGRKWRWDAGQNKYLYVRKDGTTGGGGKASTASASPAAAAPPAVVAPTALSYYQRQKLAKQRQSVQSPSHVAGDLTNPKYANKAILFAKLSPEVQDISKALGVIPFDKEAEDYIKTNYEALFKKAAEAKALNTKDLPAWVRGIESAYFGNLIPDASENQLLKQPGSWSGDEEIRGWPRLSRASTRSPAWAATGTLT